VAKVEQPKTTTTRTDSKQAYEQESKDNTRNQTSGLEEQTQTLNPNALFKPTAGTTADQEVVHGNRLAPEGESESHKGEGTGLNTIGNVEFDGGLRGRGVVAGYPRPSGNNAVGKVVVSVVVNSEGKVESATVRGQGTTTNDPTLRANAVNAARKTKFKPDSLRMTQTGTITYKYIVN
jgi:TonB family protein